MLKALATIGVLQLLTMVLLLVRTKVLALLLGPANLGLLAVVDKLVAVAAQTAALSMPFAALRYLSPLWDGDRREFATRFVAMRNVLLVLAALVTAAGVGISLQHPGLFGAEYEVRMGPTLALAFATVPVLMLVPFVQSAIAARMRQNGAMLFSLAHAGVFALTAIVGAWVAGVRGIYAAYAVAGLLFVAVLLRRIRAPHAPRGFPLALPRPVWRFSTTLLVLTFVMPYAALYLHYRVLRLHGAEAAGWMQAALGLALAVRTCMGAAQSVFLTPNVNRDVTPTERLRWANAFQRSLALLLMGIVPPLVLFPDVAVRVLYSADFAPAATFVGLFVAGEVVTMLSGTYQSLILANDRLGFHVAQNLFAQLATLVVGALLIPEYGIGGAAAATLCAPVVLYATTTLFVGRTLGSAIPAELHRLGGLLLGAVVAAGIAGIALPGCGLTTLVMKAALYGAIVLVAWGRLDAPERVQLQQFVGTLRGRLRLARAS
jgi:antigen flippase